MKKLVSVLIDVPFAVISLVLGPLLRAVTRLGPTRLPLTYRIFDAAGCLPMSFQFYQPAFNTRLLPEDTWKHRLPIHGVELSMDKQLEFLESFSYRDELEYFLRTDRPASEFHHADSFGTADSEALYSMIRHVKPRRIIEIGSGQSTKIARAAVEKNSREGVSCRHCCIEPYAAPWLEQIGVEVYRQRVEQVDPELFGSLEAGDILFIDSSHVIRAQGDVVCEYLSIVPSLNPGVLVHVHDIFIPYEYPREWLVKKKIFWNEQYLLQALLSHSDRYEVLLALNFLHRENPQALIERFPAYAKNDRGHGSFWFRVVDVPSGSGD